MDMPMPLLAGLCEIEWDLRRGAEVRLKRLGVVLSALSPDYGSLEAASLDLRGAVFERRPLRF